MTLRAREVTEVTLRGREMKGEGDAATDVHALLQLYSILP